MFSSGRKSSQYRISNIVEKDCGRDVLMFWVGIMANRYTDCHVFDSGTLIGLWYRDEILAPYLRLFFGEYGPNLILMDDSAHSHRAQLVDECFKS
ncbi:uncharacterized protein TNCV_2856201 [Trichonephila clavipes]|nr:uncharacterized protein TNCV_2856201 [Trichonephila clavipes]